MEDQLQKGALTQQDALLLKDLDLKNDKHLSAAWESYQVLLDEEDLADTFVILCDVRREQMKDNKQEQPQVQEYGFKIRGPEIS
mmetsp:Transcript_38716/g.37060  ORF Transcript_38716/g.37060 Transcript_38716/m.37060 type:complete len:84 (+) Transcript_38716:999-1250(+)